VHIGHYISGAGHVGLITWVLFGGMFSEAEHPVEVTQVSVISAEEFAALNAAVQPPEMLSDVPQPAVPDTEEAPKLESAADSPPELPEPVVAEPALPDPEPQVAPEPPAAEVEDTPPVIQPPAEEMAALTPEPDPEPAPREAPRVAPEPVAPPEPDVKIDDQPSRQTTPDQPAEEVVEPEEEAAPEAATTEIVTEAEESGSAAPATSLRPRARPVRQAAVEPEAETEPEPTTSNDSVNAALAEAMAEAQAETPRPASGPPLTRGEQDALRIAVQQCWVVDVGSRAANVTVTLAMSLDRSGKIVAGSLKMVSGEGGDQRAIQTAFQSARRAVLRCQKGGYNLPPEKYDQWRDIEMTFNPERMRIK
jgi:hypothetical protein